MSNCLFEDNNNNNNNKPNSILETNYTAILQVKSKFTPFTQRIFFSNYKVLLCATYGEI